MNRIATRIALLLLVEYGFQVAAIEAVESDLARVFRIDLPGKDETLFGVAIRGGSG